MEALSVAAGAGWGTTDTVFHCISMLVNLVPTLSAGLYIHFSTLPDHGASTKVFHTFEAFSLMRKLLKFFCFG